MQVLSTLALATPFLAGVHALTKSSGCDKDLPSGISTSSTNNDQTFTPTNSDVRHYNLHLPSSYKSSTPHPLIFAYHGRGEDAASQEHISQLSESAYNHHALVVYPEGLVTSTSEGKQIWQGDPDATANDVAFTTELADHLASQYCIDTDSLFATGKSNGGGFTVNILACDPAASTKFAAFAGVASADYQPVPSSGSCPSPDDTAITCTPGRTNVPVFEHHGHADQTIHYSGGSGERRERCLPSIPHFMTEWAKRDGLGSGNNSNPNYDGVTGLTQFTWGGNTGVDGLAAEVVHLSMKGAGHHWPSVAGYDGGDAGYDVTTYIMKFFADHSL